MAKKITIIVTLVLAVCLIVATIIMANVNVYYGVKCAKPDFVYVQYSSNVAKMLDSKESEKIKSLIEDASKEKALNALFGGNLNNKATISASSTNKTVPSSSGYKIRFVYNNPQKLMDGNKVYKDGDGNSYTYLELVFIISNTEGENQVDVYVIENSSAPTTYTHMYYVDADYTELLNYLNNKGYNN